jgi:uncharacterized membrane protein YbhN (UPF0104 family)
MASTPVAHLRGERSVGRLLRDGRTRRWLRRAPVGLIGLLVVLGIGHGHQLASAITRLTHLRWEWLIMALGLESASMVVFAQIQQRLLRAGNVRIGLTKMTAITLAGNALSLTLPGGVAWGTSFVFGRLRRSGADRVVAGWVVLVTGALGSFALFLVVAAGIEIAGGQGPAAHLRAMAAALAALPIVAGGMAALGRRAARTRHSGDGLSSPSHARVPLVRPLAHAAGRLVQQVRLVHLDRRGWVGTGALAALNWLDDCACLVACIWAVGGAVPWRGLLVAYGLAQVAASVPLVPGSLGIVEGTLSFLLVGYGMTPPEALASVLLYRLVSFWAIVPMGWGIWGCITFGEHRSERAAGLATAPGREPAAPGTKPPSPLELAA